MKISETLDILRSVTSLMMTVNLTLKECPQRKQDTCHPSVYCDSWSLDSIPGSGNPLIELPTLSYSTLANYTNQQVPSVAHLEVELGPPILRHQCL